jgi:phage gpG-like protein
MPAPLRLRSTSDGAASAAALRQLGRQVADFRPAWQEARGPLAQGLARNLDSQGGALGVRWPPRVTRSSRPPLVRTGRLRATIGSATLGTRTLTSRRLVLGPDQRYQFVQHYGSEKRRIPARPFLGWTEAMVRAVEDAVGRHVERQLETARRALGGAA